MLTPADLRRIAADLQLRPTKKLGQNFVGDPNTVRRIVTLADPTPDDVVLEVGPGLGSLTVGLLDGGRHVVAVEIDATMAAALPRTVAEHAGDTAVERLRVVGADALRVTASDVRTSDGAAPTVLVANLPYNVAVPVVLHLLAELPTVVRALVMVQAEVADRMAAGPGSRVYGVPSVKLAWYGTATKVAAVPRTVFWPVPNVDSALVSFARGEPPLGVERDAVFELVDRAFAQRRKTLRSALAGWAGSAARAGELITAAGIDPSVRGEQLPITQFAALARVAATSWS